MYRIIEWELSIGKKWHQPPHRVPSECLPSKSLFNRKDDLWWAILRCWNPNPEIRPHSWELQKWIGDVLENPWNLNENEDYITRFSSSDTTNLESTYEDRIASSSNL